MRYNRITTAVVKKKNFRKENCEMSKESRAGHMMRNPFLQVEESLDPILPICLTDCSCNQLAWVSG